jgi:hypothetical protein
MAKTESRMASPAERMKAMRRRVASQVRRLNRDHELDALKWIEAVSEFDTDETR